MSRLFQDYLKLSNRFSISKCTAKHNFISKGIYIYMDVNIYTYIYIYAVKSIFWHYFWSTWNSVEIRIKYTRHTQDLKRCLLLCQHLSSCSLLPSFEISMIWYLLLIYQLLKLANSASYGIFRLDVFSENVVPYFTIMGLK